MMGRATRFGLIAGGLAVVLWPAFAMAQAPWRLPFMAALAVTAVCGAAVLIITIVDLITVRRARSVLPARMFDLALGLILTLPSTNALMSLLH